ncbi:hypothetical protein QR680_008773 [Steinernema hermaphroditum]|uniref:C2H2-type domain-containing protein n=1 Tax=Steinernema hermaphroditum TaxID=289476 RepID=A0AA39M8I2_9BILA|nr:hypothetical protein QR680_008773 [Steinernema hermaphroditum]
MPFDHPSSENLWLLVLQNAYCSQLMAQMMTAYQPPTLPLAILQNPLGSVSAPVSSQGLSAQLTSHGEAATSLSGTDGRQQATPVSTASGSPSEPCDPPSTPSTSPQDSTPSSLGVLWTGSSDRSSSDSRAMDSSSKPRTSTDGHFPSSFAETPRRKTHLRNHTCTVCQKQFCRASVLKDHIRLHTNEKPFACSHCGRRFPDRSNWRVHEKTHSREKTFLCGECGKAFAQKNYLTKHEKRSHGKGVRRDEAGATEDSHAERGANGSS